MSTATLMLFVAACIIPVISATQHVVGNRDGWNPDADAGTNYTAWADKHRFQVGDLLVFWSFQHRVIYKVDAQNYAICNRINWLAKYETKGSNNVAYVNLDSAGEWYFVDRTPGNCDARMKMEISVYSQAESESHMWIGDAESEILLDSLAPSSASSPSPARPPFQRPSSARLAHSAPTFLAVVALAFIALVS